MVAYATYIFSPFVGWARFAVTLQKGVTSENMRLDEEFLLSAIDELP